ncbi:hypothetical protein appser4_5730 [Actinobacillus pleuropneumoniae serovar 4 str. M62]|nr:hypothetical protein appser4_5730 [Actinobacillus pleuropneumoniae serovar 4 str. M62]
MPLSTIKNYYLILFTSSFKNVLKNNNLRFRIKKQAVGIGKFFAKSDRLPNGDLE